MTDPRYPIGKFSFEDSPTQAQRDEWLNDIATLPQNLRESVEGLSEKQLDTPYREGGWTLRQVVHHVADSHMNSYIRFRLALTEDAPTIKPYNEAAWAELVDAYTLDVETSLVLLETLHKRWVTLLKSLNASDWARTFTHPESGREASLERNLALYSWHGQHHTAHITSLRERNGW